MVVLGWLVLELTDSVFLVGLVGALQWLPMLLGAFTGLIADRFNRRVMLIWLQFSSALACLLLGFLIITGLVQIWQIMILSLLLGITWAIDFPCARALIPDLVGKENIPKEGPLIIVANHMSLADPPVLAVSINRRVIFMAKQQLFRSPLTSYLIRSLGAFPVHRGQLDMSALKQAEQVLQQGLALAMFPEGMRSRRGRLKEAFSGAALIARHSGAPILPVGISGTEKIKSTASLLRRPRITVNIGHTFYLTAGSDRLTKAALKELTDDIMEHIAELLPQEYRGSYSREDS